MFCFLARDCITAITLPEFVLGMSVNTYKVWRGGKSIKIDYRIQRKEKKMAVSEEKIKEYLKSNQRIVLATVNTEGSPDIRILGGYGVDGYTIYFSTTKTSNKNLQLNENKNTAVLFQHDNQFISKYFNVTIYGEAVLLGNDLEFEKGRDSILNKNPNIKITTKTHNIYKIIPKNLKVLDFGEANTEDRVTLIQVL